MSPGSAGDIKQRTCLRLVPTDEGRDQLRFPGVVLRPIEAVVPGRRLAEHAGRRLAAVGAAAEVILDQRDPPRTIHDPREVLIPRSELRVVLTVAVAEEPARWPSVGVLCGFLVRLPLLRPLELRRAA